MNIAPLINLIQSLVLAVVVSGVLILLGINNIILFYVCLFLVFGGKIYYDNYIVPARKIKNMGFENGG